MIRNKVEEHVIEAYEALKVHFPAFCACEVCKADVLVFALNRLPARYVSTLEGTVITELSLDRQQNRATIEVAVMDGLRRVAQSPRCKTASSRSHTP
jgi:competence protein ComFB